MILRIICNVITVAVCFISVIVPIIRMKKFPAILENRLKALMPSYDKSKTVDRIAGGYSAEDYWIVNEKRRSLNKLVIVDFFINFFCFLVGVICCCIDGVPIQEDDLLFIIYFLSAVIYAVGCSVYYVIQIKKFQIQISPSDERFRYVRYGTQNDIKFNAVFLGCLAAIFVGGSFVTATHVIMAWL